MAKEPQEDNVVTIKKLLETKKMIIGTQRTLKGLKNGSIKKVYIAKNTNKETKDDLTHYAQINGVQVVELEMPNDELRIICKKPFNISVLGQI